MTVVDLLESWGPVVPQPIGQPVSGRVRLFGFGCRETSGAAPASVLVFNQPNGGGLEILPINLDANGSDRDWFGPNGILLANGYLPVVTGAVSGSVFVRYEAEGGI